MTDQAPKTYEDTASMYPDLELEDVTPPDMETIDLSIIEEANTPRPLTAIKDEIEMLLDLVEAKIEEEKAEDEAAKSNYSTPTKILFQDEEVDVFKSPEGVEYILEKGEDAAEVYNSILEMSESVRGRASILMSLMVEINGVHTLGKTRNGNQIVYGLLKNFDIEYRQLLRDFSFIAKRSK